MEASLSAQRLEYSARRFLAMPLAGTIVWLCIAVAGATLPIQAAAWALFIGTGSIDLSVADLSLLEALRTLARKVGAEVGFVGRRGSN